MVHAYQGGVLKKKITERGHVLIKKPGKMRWEYSQPEKKLFVSDGVKVYSYVPADKQVTVGAVPKDDQAGAPILFLAGKGNLARDFKASVAELPAGAPDPTGTHGDCKMAGLEKDRAARENHHARTFQNQERND